MFLLTKSLFPRRFFFRPFLAVRPYTDPVFEELLALLRAVFKHDAPTIKQSPQVTNCKTIAINTYKNVNVVAFISLS